MMHHLRPLTVFLACLLTIQLALADEVTHEYAPGENIKIYANKIGPYHNPLETYAYFEMPGCKPASDDHKFPTIGQALAGDEFFEMNIPIQFGVSVTKKTICSYSPTAEDIRKWQSMVAQQYWYQLTADELHMWAVLGNHSSSRNNASPQPDTLFLHQHFQFGTNGNRIVLVNLTVDTPVDLTTLTAGTPLAFLYSATFHETPEISFAKRFDRYLDDTFFEHRIHWFSIFNSFMVVLFLVAVVMAILLRTLRADISMMAADERAMLDQGKDDWVEDSGWKQLHADVFRVPKQPVLLCALLGTGCQLVAWSLVLISLAMLLSVYTSSGAFATYGVASYVLTSVVGGYSSSYFFQKFAQVGPNLSAKWTSCMLLTATMFPAMVLGGGFLLNFVAIAYDSAQAIPFGGMVALLAIWLLLCCPLVVLGTVFARHSRSTSSAAHRPSSVRNAVPRVNQIPRLIPPRPWYCATIVLVIGGGALPFGSIFIELYLIFASLWNYKLYYVFGFMLFVFVMLLLVTACVSIVGTYFLLSAEDHRWHWSCVYVGASTAGYVFLYAVYYYYVKTMMSGFFMFAFYFTYMGMLCVAIGVLCATVSYVASYFFVRTIYRTVKTD